MWPQSNFNSMVNKRFGGGGGRGGLLNILSDPLFLSCLARKMSYIPNVASLSL